MLLGVLLGILLTLSIEFLFVLKLYSNFAKEDIKDDNNRPKRNDTF